MSLPEDYARLASELKKLAKLLEVWTIKLKKLIGMLAVAILRFPASQLVGLILVLALRTLLFSTLVISRDAKLIIENKPVTMIRSRVALQPGVFLSGNFHAVV